MAAIVVLYHPTPEDIQSIAALSNDLCRVVAVVNAIDPDNEAALRAVAPWGLIRNADNLGLAIAINLGCHHAFGNGADYVIIFDQDSRPSATLVADLCSDWQRLTAEGRLLGAIGPTLLDRKAKNGKRGSDEPDACTEMSLATSGTLISKDAFLDVGPMDEWLFIDGIDHEWCFRARDRGRLILRMTGRTMDHDMGDSGITILGRYRPIHRSPLRHHYIVRNTTYLLSKRHVPFGWKLAELAKTLYRIPVYIAVSQNRPQSIKLILSGLRVGFAKAVKG